jgi:hypothetical protein
MRRILISLCLVSLSQPLLAQTPGQNILVNVRIGSVTRNSDTAGVSYVIDILPASSEQFGRFSVDAPGGVLRIANPGPARQWATATDFDGRPLAHWVGGMTPAGSSTPELHFDAVGLPGILTYWVGGVFVYPSREEDAAAPADPYQAEMLNGQTVGIEPWPADRSAQSLLARLRGLTQRSCATPLQWISSSTLCDDLMSDLDQAESFRSNGQAAEARTSLNAFIAAITGSPPGSPAPGVTTAGYWLLQSNASIVLELL